MITKAHRVPRVTYRDLGLIFRLLTLAAAAVELEAQRQAEALSDWYRSVGHSPDRFGVAGYWSSDDDDR